MSELTPNLGLFKYNTSTDGKEVFSINAGLNNNWDKIDACKVSKSSGETYMKFERTDTDREIGVGIGEGGQNRGIYDFKLSKWAFKLDENNKAYILDNEVISSGNLVNISTYAETIVSWGMPDYTSGVVISSSGYTAPSNGWIWAAMNTGACDFYIDGAHVYYQPNTGNAGYCHPCIIYPIAKGSIFTYSGYSPDYKFYPGKGV